MMMCTVCGGDPQHGLALCLDCTGRLDNPVGLCIEHIAWMGAAPISSRAALIDQWGRPHYLRDQTLLGRTPDDGIAVLERSISRGHAEVIRGAGGWQVRDLGSHNGTHVDGVQITEPTTLKSEQIVALGDVAFYFLARPELTSIGAIAIATSDPMDRGHGESSAPGHVLRLVAPPGDVGGMIELDGVALRLSEIQFAFVTLLAERICAETELSALVRGFVRSSELLTDLPWDTSTPVSDNVKQLVRRVRSAMEAAGFDDIIESRHRFGYRLRLVPEQSR